MKEEKLSNSEFFKDWGRNTFIDVELIFCDKPEFFRWQGVFESTDIANEQINHIKTPYLEDMEEEIRNTYGEDKEIYYRERTGTGDYFWYNETRNVKRVELCIENKDNEDGYMTCYSKDGLPMVYEFRYKFIKNTPYKKLKDDWTIYLISEKASNVNEMFGDCKNKFVPCGYTDGSAVEEYWKEHSSKE